MSSTHVICCILVVASDVIAAFDSLMIQSAEDKAKVSNSASECKDRSQYAFVLVVFVAIMLFGNHFTINTNAFSCYLSRSYENEGQSSWLPLISFIFSWVIFLLAAVMLFWTESSSETPALCHFRYRRNPVALSILFYLHAASAVACCLTC